MDAAPDPRALRLTDAGATRRTTPSRLGARGRWPLRDGPTLLWAVLALTVAVAHPWIRGSGWLLIHLVLLGALTHSIMVWSAHFAQSLLKASPTLDVRRAQSARLWTLLAGTSLVLVGVPTSSWPMTLVGGGGVVVAVLWHAAQLCRRLRQARPGRFRVTGHYYMAAAASLPVGVALGVLLAGDLSGEARARLAVAHAMINLFGWVGLTVTGTLVMLWPTMLRTRIDDRAERWAQQALPFLGLGLGVVVAGALWGPRWSVVLGIGCYGAGLVWWGRALLSPARASPPREHATASVAAALLWLAVGVSSLGVVVARGASWELVSHSLGPLTSIFVLGFGAQVLIGALSYLLPAVLGGGPVALKAGKAWFQWRTTNRLVAVNGGLALSLLPLPAAARTTALVVALAGLATFLPLMVGALRARTGRGAPAG
ncbi:MAG: hypothetical protein ABI181_05385 [Mycobacteriaceae bacterium]